MRGAHRGRLVVSEARRQRHGQAGVTRDERGPATVFGEAADMVTRPMSRHVGTDRGHNAGKIHTELWCIPVDTGVPAEGVEDIGEVEAGCGHRDLDLSRPRRNAFERGQFHRFQVTGRADLPAHAVVRVVHHGGSPLLGA